MVFPCILPVCYFWRGTDGEIQDIAPRLAMGFNIIVELPGGCRCLHARDSLEGTSLSEFVESQVCLDDFFLVHDGKLLTPDSVIGGSGGHTLVRCVPRLIGGKGGFGSMLRTIGNQIEKTTNKDACRDLTGRRIRDVKADKQVEEWQKGEADRDRLRAEARKERRNRLLAEPKSTFDSHSYLTELKDQAEKTEDAVRIGLLAQKSRGASAAAAGVSVSAVKRSSSTSGGASKRKCATMRALDRFTCDGLDSDSDSSSEEEEEEESTTGDSKSASEAEAGAEEAGAEEAGAEEAGAEEAGAEEAD